MNHSARVALLLCLVPAFAVAADDSSFGTQVDGIFHPLYPRTGPGCVVAVARPDKPVLVRSYGLADVENGVPLTPSATLDIGSISKQFTATAVLLLAQRHQIDLHDDIRKYLPELPVYERPITVEDLLHQTSGLRDAYEILKMQGSQIYEDLVTNADVFAVVAAQHGVNFGAGDEYSYSNTNYFLLGRIVERVARQSLGKFLRKEIFNPLNLTSGVLRESHRALIPRRARAYFEGVDGTVTTSDSNDEVTGDGNLFISAVDLVRWNESLAAGKIGGPELWTRLITAGRLRDGSEAPYGAGLAISRRGGLTIFSHGGASAGYHAYSLLIPERRISVVVLCNVRDSRPGTSPSRLAFRVSDLLLGTATADIPRPERRETTPVSIDAERYAGTFLNRKDGAVIAIRVRNGSLTVVEDFSGGSEQALTFTNAREAHGADITITFNDTDGGRVSSLTRTEDHASAVFERVPEIGSVDGSSTLSELAGVYRSAEAHVDWEIENRSGTLYLRVPRRAPEPLVAVFQDAFYAEQWTLIFTRRSGGIDGMDVVNERVRSMRFDRQAGSGPESPSSRP